MKPSEVTEPGLIVCIGCGWSGPESDFVMVEYESEDGYRTSVPQMARACPACMDLAWEPVE